MTILHIITRLILGGAQLNTVMTCAAQVDAGHEVHLAFGPIFGPEGSLRERADACGATIHVVDHLRRAISPRHDLIGYKSLRQLIRSVKPDIVHTHSSKAGILGRAAAWKERQRDGGGVPKVVHTIHGLPFHDRQSPVLRRAYIAAERWAARRCDRLVGITPAMCDAFAASRIGRPEQFTVIPSGIDITRFNVDHLSHGDAKAALGITRDAPTVGIVARFDPLKGHDDLLDIVSDLRQRFECLRVVFVGDGWDRARIEQRIADESLGDVVTLTGLLPPDDVPAVMRAIDVMVLPSYQEGQSRTLAEGLLCGCGIVGYNVGGIPEVCVDGQTGLLVPVGDRAALRRAVERLLDNLDERQSLTDAGRRHIVENFSDQVMMSRIEALYREMLST